MMLNSVLTGDIEHEWPRLSKALQPVVERSKSESMSELLDRLKSGWASAFDVTGDASGVVVLSVGLEAGVGDVMFIDYLTGQIEGGPKTRAKTMEIVLTEIELIARSNKCAEVGGMVRRGAGWIRFASRFGYRVAGDQLRKRL